MFSSSLLQPKIDKIINDRNKNLALIVLDLSVNIRFKMAYNVLRLKEVGDFHHKC